MHLRKHRLGRWLQLFAFAIKLIREQQQRSSSKGKQRVVSRRLRHCTRYSTLSRMRTSFGCSFCGALAGATEESKGPPSLPLLDAAHFARLPCSCSKGASSQSPLGERTLMTCTAS